jgi:paraquat-inducible protein A
MQPSPIDAHEPPDPAGRLRECPDCGLLLRLPALPRGAVARCPRCEAVLRRRHADPIGRPLALTLTGLLLFALANGLPFIELDYRTGSRAINLFTGPEELNTFGMWELALVVLLTTLAVPLAKLLALSWVLLALHLRRPPAHLYTVMRWIEWLGPWSMVEVFLLGVFVAYTRLTAIAHVEVGGALYALGGLMLAMAAADALFDRHAVWDTLQQRGITAGPVAPPAHRADAPRSLLACGTCGLVSHRPRRCPRCGATLHRRKPDSIARTWALLAAAAILYVPANLLPVMTVTQFGSGVPNTILSGVMELAAEGMWPLAAVVFVASITVPLLKIGGLTIMLLSIQRRARRRLRERTRLYRIVVAIGRWSMVDVFMVSILTGMVRLGVLASVSPGPGAVAFCAVVILTMVAAATFDPRLMWDAARRPRA